MTRRITIPEEHIAVILPNQLGDELMSLLTELRQVQQRIAKARTTEETKHHARQRINIAGDVMLALLEAKEG